MLLGLVRPTAGGGTVLGEPIGHPERYLGRVGALIEGPALWPALTATENLRVLARLGAHDESRIPELLDLVGLADRAGDRFGRYSFGMKQRLGIAAALLGDPELLVLDEPTNGLDPVGITEMRDLIGRLSGGDRTVLVSSHLLSELEHVCDWLLIIDGGRLVYAGEREGFSGRGGHRDRARTPRSGRPAAVGRPGRGARPRRRTRGRAARAGVARCRRPRPRGAPQRRRGRRRASRSPRCTCADPRSSPATSACSKETPDDPFLPCRARQAPATARGARRVRCWPWCSPSARRSSCCRR